MRYEIILSPEAIEDLRNLTAYWRARVKDAIEIHLRYEPTQKSKSRIKLEHDPRFLQRIAEARQSLRLGQGVKLEDIGE